MKIETQRSGDTVTLCLIGRLTADRNPKHLLASVERVVGGGARRLVLDLRRVSYMDSTCLSDIVQAWAAAWQCGRQLRLVNVPPRVRRLFELSRLCDVLQDRSLAPTRLMSVA